MKIKLNMHKVTQRLFQLSLLGTFFYAGFALAATDGKSPAGSIGELADNAVQSFSSIGALMIAAAYIAGFILVIGAIFKFKQHKDNPTQIPMGTPVALLAIGAVLIFLPSIIGPVGKTIFKDSPIYGGATGEGFKKIGTNNAAPG